MHPPIPFCNNTSSVPPVVICISCSHCCNIFPLFPSCNNASPLFLCTYLVERVIDGTDEKLSKIAKLVCSLFLSLSLFIKNDQSSIVLFRRCLKFRSSYFILKGYSASRETLFLKRAFRLAYGLNNASLCFWLSPARRTRLRMNGNSRSKCTKETSL